MRALTSHPAFSMANPNRVRALIGAFAQANHTQFNRADGAGYEFVADVVLALDPKNPQVAARIMGAFRSWRALEAGGGSARKPRCAASPKRRRCRAMSTTSSRARSPVAEQACRHRRGCGHCDRNVFDKLRFTLRSVPEFDNGNAVFRARAHAKKALENSSKILTLDSRQIDSRRFK